MHTHDCQCIENYVQNSVDKSAYSVFILSPDLISQEIT